MIYFNNGATSYPKAKGVAESAEDALNNLPGAANRGGIEDFDIMDKTRRKLAKVMGVANHKQIGLGANATWGLDIAIFGIGLSAGDWVVTSMSEHNSVLRPLHKIAVEKGVNIEYVPTDKTGRIMVDEWTRAIENRKPKLCVFTHASNVTGALNDPQVLAEPAQSMGATVLLDTAQTLGFIDLNLDKWKIDLAAFTGHKYLLGPQGTGGLFVREGFELTPYLVGGTGIRSELDTMPEEMPLRIEAGTGNEPGFHGLLCALTWAEKNPVDRTTIAKLVEILNTGLISLNANVIDPGAPRMPTVSFTIDGIAPDEVGSTLLDSYDIIVRTGLHCAPRIFECLSVDPKKGTIRVSMSRFSTQIEVVELISAINDIIASKDNWI